MFSSDEIRKERNERNETVSPVEEFETVAKEAKKNWNLLPVLQDPTAIVHTVLQGVRGCRYRHDRIAVSYAPRS